MPNTITNTTIVKGKDLVVNQIQISSDGSEETDYIVYDSSAVATLLGKTDTLKCKILRVQVAWQKAANLATWTFEYDASLDVTALPVQLGASTNAGFIDMDFRDMGGIENLAGSGATGDVLLTTTVMDSGDKMLLNIYVQPY